LKVSINKGFQVGLSQQPEAGYVFVVFSIYSILKTSLWGDEMHKIVNVKPLPDYRLDLEFDDGVTGVADVSSLVGKGVFAQWNDIRAFEKVSVGSAGELVWDGRIDLCPDSLYMKVTGKKPEEVFPALACEHTQA